MAALGPLLGSYRLETDLPRDSCIGLPVFFCSLLLSSLFSPFLSFPHFHLLCCRDSASARTSKTLHIINMPRPQRTRVADHISSPNSSSPRPHKNVPHNSSRIPLRLKCSLSSIDSYPPKCQNIKNTRYFQHVTPAANKGGGSHFIPQLKFPTPSQKCSPQLFGNIAQIEELVLLYRCGIRSCYWQP